MAQDRIDYWMVQILAALTGHPVRDVLSQWQESEVIGTDHSADIIATLNRLAQRTKEVKSGGRIDT